MRRTKALLLIAAIIGCALPLHAQQNSGTFRAGEPLDIMPNTRVFGSFHFAESCSYDPVRDLYVAPNAGERGDGTENFAAVPASGSGIALYGEQRGVTAADFNNDGRADLAGGQRGAATRLFINRKTD